MNMEPLVSICCITYNHVAHISQCLDGFLMQKTTFIFEILIHDDASTDGTADIIRKYVAKYPHLIKPVYQVENQYSKGVKIMSTYNYSRARGKYIALCEGDDYWIDPLKLQKQIDVLESDSSIGLVYTDFYVYDENEKRMTSFPLKVKNGDGFSECLKGELGIWTLTVCFRKSLLIDLPVLGENYFSGDRLLWLEFTRKSNIQFLPYKTSVYRVLSHSASHITNVIENKKFHYLIANTHLCYLYNYPLKGKYTALNSRIEKKFLISKFVYAIYSNDYNLFKQIDLHFLPVISLKYFTRYCVFKMCQIPYFFKLLNKMALKK